MISERFLGSSNNMQVLHPYEYDQEDLGIHILLWVDYTSKYGIGYYLSNKSYGVHFNDCSKIIMKDGLIGYFEKNSDAEKI